MAMRMPPVATIITRRFATLAVVTLQIATAGVGCGSSGDTITADADHESGVTADAAPDSGPGDCARDARGTACVIALHAAARASCDPTLVAQLATNLGSRRGELPLWDAGLGLFVADRVVAIAGEWNQWSTTSTVTTRLCASDLFTATTPVPSGFWPYKQVDGTTWRLDPWNWGFAYDDFAGNVDGRNSVLDTPDSGRGHLIARPEPVCSTALGNCRQLLAYVPPGYQASANATTTYPVVYLHDGQNVFDDHACCFGHTGWEVNVTLDAEIAAHRVAPIIVVAAEHGGANRNDEYGWSQTVGGKQELFMQFQLATVQPTAESLWRIDPARRVVAGSSLGGLISMRLALEHPTMYRGVASISGAFWPGQDTSTALRDRLPSIGHVPVAIYLDHGGNPTTGGDGYQDNVEIRDQLAGLGWSRSNSPGCSAGPATVCYWHELDATHDELAWRDRAWRWLRYFFPG
jgi:predicted alpha/beta superfamily hydrolase